MISRVNEPVIMFVSLPLCPYASAKIMELDQQAKFQALANRPRCVVRCSFWNCHQRSSDVSVEVKLAVGRTKELLCHSKTCHVVLIACVETSSKMHIETYADKKGGSICSDSPHPFLFWSKVLDFIVYCLLCRLSTPREKKRMIKIRQRLCLWYLTTLLKTCGGSLVAMVLRCKGHGSNPGRGGYILIGAKCKNALCYVQVHINPLTAMTN